MPQQLCFLSCSVLLAVSPRLLTPTHTSPCYTSRSGIEPALFHSVFFENSRFSMSTMQSRPKSLGPRRSGPHPYHSRMAAGTGHCTVTHTVALTQARHSRTRLGGVLCCEAIESNGRRRLTSTTPSPALSQHSAACTLPCCNPVLLPKRTSREVCSSTTDHLEHYHTIRYAVAH